MLSILPHLIWTHHFGQVPPDADAGTLLVAAAKYGYLYSLACEAVLHRKWNWNQVAFIYQADDNWANTLATYVTNAFTADNAVTIASSSNLYESSSVDACNTGNI